LSFTSQGPDQQAAFVAEERAEFDECSCSSDEARMSSLTVNDLLYDRDSDTSLSRELKAHDEQELILSLFKETL